LFKYTEQSKAACEVVRTLRNALRAARPRAGAARAGGAQGRIRWALLTIAARKDEPGATQACASKCGRIRGEGSES